MEKAEILILILILVSDDRFKPANSPTPRARVVEMERLHLLASQCRQRKTLAPANREETFLTMVEWAESQGHH